MLYVIARRVADLINPPTAVDLAKRELEDARRELLHWEALKERADSTVPMLKARIIRLHTLTKMEVSVTRTTIGPAEFSDKSRTQDFGDNHAC